MATMFDCANRSSHEIYDEIKRDYEEAYKCIDKGLKLDEEGKTDEAINMYEFGLNIIDVALGRPVESPTSPDIEWEKTYAMIQKMRKSRKEILSRISDAQVRSPEAAAPPPSYDEAVAAAGGSVPPHQVSFVPTPGPSCLPYIPPSAQVDVNIHNNPTPGYADLNARLNEMRVMANREIIYSHNNVRLYFIAPDGRVSATSEPDTLIIGRIEELGHEDVLDETLLSIVDELSSNSDQGKSQKRHRHHRHSRRHRHHHHRSEQSREIPQGSGQIYLQVGSWVYPLIPGISPCYRTDYGAFILPDVHSGVEGAAIGLILPPTADKSVYELLNSILLRVVEKRDLDPRSHRRHRRTHPRPESNLSSNLVRGASYIANNIVRGAGSASRLIDSAAPKLMNHISPATDQQSVNPALKKTVGVAKSVTGTAASVTDYLAGKVGNAASALGQYLAPHVQKHGTRLLTSTTKMSEEEASQKVDNLLDATAGAVQSIATVYSGLEEAAGVLGRSLSNNTVQIIQYKYGTAAGDITNDVMSTAGNVYTVHGNYKLVKPKGLAKSVAKNAVKGAGKAFQEYDAAGPHAEFQGSGPGAGLGFAPNPSSSSSSSMSSFETSEKPPNDKKEKDDLKK